MTKLIFVVVIVAVGAGVVVGVAAVVCAAGNTMCICLAGHNGPSNDLHSRAGQRPSPSSCVCVSVSPNYKAARVGRKNVYCCEIVNFIEAECMLQWSIFIKLISFNYFYGISI